MRLNKRIAIGVLAAVMALSMLTACSDSGGGSTTAPSGGSGTSVGGNTNTEPDDKKDDTTQPPKEDNKKDDTKNDTMPLQTRAEKFFSGRYTINGAKWTYTVQRTQTSLDDGRQSTGVYIIASDGKRTMDRCLFDNGKDATTIIDWQQQREYSFDSTNQGDTVFIQNWEEDYSETNYGYLCYDVWHQRTYKKPTLREFADEYIAGTYQVDGVNYYAESYIHNYDTGTQEARIYCFDQGDTEGLNLRYYINITKYAGTSQQTNKYKVMNISNTFDASLLQVPEGRDVYLRVGNDYVLQEEKTQKDNYPN